MFGLYELQSQKISLSIWEWFEEGPGVSYTATVRSVGMWSFLQTKSRIAFIPHSPRPCSNNHSQKTVFHHTDPCELKRCHSCLSIVRLPLYLHSVILTYLYCLSYRDGGAHYVPHTTSYIELKGSIVAHGVSMGYVQGILTPINSCRYFKKL